MEPEPINGTGTWEEREPMLMEQTGTDSIPEYTYQDCGIYSVTLIVTDDNGCKDTITKQVEVHCEPTCNFNYTPDCVGNPTVFTAASWIQPLQLGYGIWEGQETMLVELTLNSLILSMNMMKRSYVTLIL